MRPCASRFVVQPADGVVVRLPIWMEIEVQVAAVLCLYESDAIAHRRLTWERRTDIARPEVRARSLGTEAVSRHDPRPVHRNAPFDRQRIAAQPSTDQRTEVELSIR